MRVVAGKALDFGTEPYSPKVARRLRVLNFACWATALAWFVFFALYILREPLQMVAIVDLVVAVLIALVPLLHRYGPRAAGFAFIGIAFPAIFLVCFLLGTDSGMQVQYLAFAAGAVLIVGVERPAPTIIVGLLALALIMALEFTAPKDGGLLTTGEMRFGYVVGVSQACIIIFAVVFYAVQIADRAEAKADTELDRSEKLLLNILPGAIAERLKSKPTEIVADRYQDASVLFADMEGFTTTAADVAPEKLVEFLNAVFTTFDALVDRHHLEKVKTTGDNYMVVSGVPEPRADHTAALVRLGLDMLRTAGEMRDPTGAQVSIRVGIASGPVVAGVVGKRKIFYDVWGDTVNLASRMEATGLPGRLQLSPNAYERLEGQFAAQKRGPIDVKGKGTMMTWLVIDG